MGRTAEAARGCWPSILTAIGMHASCLVNKHGPCPLGCGGKRSFRFDDKEGRGTWICSHCGAGDGVELVKRFLDVDAREAMRRIDEVLPGSTWSPAQARKNIGRDRRRIKEIWMSSLPLRESDAAGRYLFRRLGYVPTRLGLRFHGGLDYYEGREKVGTFPAMVAAVWIGDRIVGLHRTFLTHDGLKAPVSSAKKLLTCVDSISGGAIRLGNAVPVMGVAEGIETALAARSRFHITVWSTISAHGMESFVPPECVKHLDIFADNDENATGQLAGYKLMNRLVVKDKISASVHIPCVPGTDWADHV